MDIDRVRYFHVFVETGSLVKASEILHISQPALSKALRTLESEVRAKLVEQDGRGLKLTPAGAKFRDETSNLLAQWLKVSDRIRHSEKPVTRFASFEVFTTYFLEILVRYVAIESMEVHELGPGNIEKTIADDRADIGVTYLPVPVSGIEFIQIGKIKMGLFGRSDIFGKIEFSELPFAIPLMPASGTPSKIMGLDGWPDHKFERNVQYRVTMMESALALCRKGHCVVYIPEFIAKLHNENMRSEFRLDEFDVPIAQKDRLQSVFLVQRKGAAETSLHRQIAKALRSLA